MPYYIHFHSYTILVKKKKRGAACSLKKRKKKLPWNFTTYTYLKYMNFQNSFIYISTPPKLNIFYSKLYHHTCHSQSIGITIVFNSIMNNKPVCFMPSCNERITIETRASFTLGKNLKRQMKAIKVLK